MPIEVTQVEHRIHIGKWEGVVTMEDVFNSSKATNALASEHGYTSYVQIIDSRELVRVPFEIRMMGKVTKLDEGKTLLYIIIGGPNWVQFLARLVASISTQPFQHVDTMEEALEVARARLKKERPDDE